MTLFAAVAFAVAIIFAASLSRCRVVVVFGHISADASPRAVVISSAAAEHQSSVASKLRLRPVWAPASTLRGFDSEWGNFSLILVLDRLQRARRSR